MARLGAGELLDVVDQSDRPLRQARLSTCLEQGLLHRAVAVLVVRPGGKVLLQRRSVSDRWHPGLWTLTSTGHVRAGESYERAASRELGEEAGIAADLKPVARLLLRKIRSRGLTEWEHVALYLAESGEPASADPVELEELREFTFAEAEAMVRGRRLTPDAKVLLSVCLDSIRGRPGSRPSRRGPSAPGRARR